jgi:hypothetical protein
MDRSGAGGGAYLLLSNVSIRSGKRKHLLFIAKLGQKESVTTQLGDCWPVGRRQQEVKVPVCDLGLFTDDHSIHAG